MRRGWLGVMLLGLLAARPAAACEEALLKALWPDRAELLEAARQPRRCDTAPGPAGATFVVVLEGETLFLGLAARGGTALATGSADPLGFESPWSASMQAAPETLLGPGQPAWRVTYANSYLSTGRSTGTEAVHIVLRRGRSLDLVFASLVDARHRSEVPCRHRSSQPCRSGWVRRWTIEAAGPARRGHPPPDLLVRSRGSGAVVSRHRWRGTAYAPPVFDRTPPLGPN